MAIKSEDFLNKRLVGFVIEPCEIKGKMAQKDEEGPYRVYNLDLDADKPYKIYVPELMADIPMGNKKTESEDTVDFSFIQNDEEGETIAEKSVKVPTCNYIVASPERLSNVEQPRLYPGEEVYITFIDNDIKKPRINSTYVSELRKRTYDRYRVFVSDRTTKYDEPCNYEFLMDTYYGIVGIRTDTGRGEISDYLFEIDTQNGTITLNDGNMKNQLILETKKNKWALTNADGSIINMEGTKLEISTPKKIEIRSESVSIHGYVNIEGSLFVDGPIICHDPTPNTHSH